MDYAQGIMVHLLSFTLSGAIGIHQSRSATPSTGCYLHINICTIAIQHTISIIP